MPAEYWDIAWKIGLPFVMVSMALGLFYRGSVVTKTAFDEMVRAKDTAFVAMVTEKNEQLRLERERSAEMFDLVKLNGGISESVLSVAKRRSPPRQS